MFSEPRRRDRAYVVRSHESTELKRFASIWTDGLKVGAMAFEKTSERLQPIAEWQSTQAALNFDFIAVLKQWHAAAPIEKVIVNGLADIEPEQHPVKRLLAPWLQCEVIEAVPPFEGLARYQEATDSERLDLAGYPGGARLTERIQRLSGGPDPLVMAFLQGIAREPKFYTHTGQTIRIDLPGRNRDIFDYMP